MYKKLLCSLLVISTTLTACENGINNVGGLPTTQHINKVSTTATTTKSVFDEKSGVYRFSYSDNFGVLLNSLEAKGEYYFNANSILWLDQNRNIKVLANINLNDTQLLHYNDFIAFIKQNNSKFKGLYQDSVVMKVIDVYSEQLSNQVYMQTDKKQLIRFSLVNGAVDLVLNNIEDFSYDPLNNIITVLQTEGAQALLKQIDVSNNTVSDGAKIALNTSLKSNTQDKDLLGSVDSYGNMASVVLSVNDSFTNEDGELTPVTKDSSYLCDNKDKTCKKDTQILSAPSTFKVNDSVPSGVSNLFNEFAQSKNLSIASMNSSYKPEATTPDIDWAKIGIVTALPIIFSVLGGFIGYYRSKLTYSKEAWKTIIDISKKGMFGGYSDQMGFVVTQHGEIFKITQFVNEHKNEFGNLSENTIEALKKTLNSTIYKTEMSTDIKNMLKVDEQNITDIFGEKFNNDTLFNLYKKNEKYIPIDPNDKISIDDFNLTSDNFHSLQIASKDSSTTYDVEVQKLRNLINLYNNSTNVEIKTSILYNILGRQNGNNDLSINNNIISSYINNNILGIRYKFIEEIYKKMANETDYKNYLSNEIMPIDIGNNETVTKLFMVDVEKIQRRQMIEWVGAGLLLAGGIVTGFYYGPFDQSFKKTITVSDQACSVTGNCSTGTVYDSNNQVIKDELGNLAMLNTGYVQDAYFTDSKNKTYSLKFYHLSNAVSCEELNTNFTKSKITNVPNFVEVNLGNNKTQILPIVDTNGIVCNLSHEQLYNMIQ